MRYRNRAFGNSCYDAGRRRPRMSPAPASVPLDYPERVRRVRRRLGMTQTELADRLGVSFATVNRWENRHVRPARLAWKEILRLEAEARAGDGAPAEPAPAKESGPGGERTVDFSASPKAVTAVAEAERLTYGHLTNPAFAAEISSVDPLPHQRMAVYERMLEQRPLRFLLADDAGAGKTIMTGLYLREIFARRRMRRVLIVPPAGLVGNWERELRTLFRLRFDLLGRAGARPENPFVGPGSDRLIASMDTLTGESVFSKLREAVSSGAAPPYDLVVFDEAHKLAARRDGDFRERPTDRYRLAAALAGVPGLPGGGPRWDLGWSAPNLLLLTATPHMGRDYPYYCLWRLLAPQALASFDAFPDFAESRKERHFIRRTKEEMVRFDGRPLYPQRQCDTLSYRLTPAEQALYDATTTYLDEGYNRAAPLNRSAARLALGVFQRRLASSTYALRRSFERRIEKLDEAIFLVQAGRADELESRQRRLARTGDYFETRDAADDADERGAAGFEEAALGGLIALTLIELREEREQVEQLLEQARSVEKAGRDAKLAKLTELLRTRFAEEKWIVFTEHRDTADFLVGRLEGLGFTGQVATIHGGLDYRERERQVEFFRLPAESGGARFLVATDAAGEGINLQFCWLMVNYDVPWNPARLEQRMGRIHRYGQKRDPVVIVNLVAGETREGRVIGAVLEKLETIRQRLGSDKVFDVVGRLLPEVSLRSYLERAATEEGEREALREIGEALSGERLRSNEERERSLYGAGEVKARLPDLEESLERERFRRLLPGYVRNFVASAAPLLDLRVVGDLDEAFGFEPLRPRAGDFLLQAVGFYPGTRRRLFTLRRPDSAEGPIWMHPGEPVFDQFCSSLGSRYREAALRGAAFRDPTAGEPYLFHLARLSVRRRPPEGETRERGAAGADGAGRGAEGGEVIESRLVGLRQDDAGRLEPMPLEHLLLLRGATDALPGAVPVARRARSLIAAAEQWLRTEELAGMVADCRARAETALEAEVEWANRGFDHRLADLVAERQRLGKAAARGEPGAGELLAEVKERQRRFRDEREGRLESLRREPALVVPGEVVLLAHALVLPTSDPESRRRHDCEVEQIAMRVATAHEEAAGWTVDDVSRPELARRAGLPDWPGFDLRSTPPAGEGKDGGAAPPPRAIEVKGRADSGGVEISDNEWARASNLRDRYWLYVVLGCATPRPRLIRIFDPFGRLLARRRGSVSVSLGELLGAAEPESSGAAAAGGSP